jgi:hypothetical protein
LAGFALIALPCAAAAADRANADVACAQGAKPLQYDCTIKLTNARTKAPLTKVELAVGADMPSMPMMHNVAPVKAAPAEEPGSYRARIELEMHGVWAVALTLSGELRDRIVKTFRFEEGSAVPASAAKPPARHKH